MDEPIAIIGSGCRFPGSSSSPSKLWKLLKTPRDVLSKIDRFEADSFFHPNGQHHGTSNVRHSYLLSEDTRVFDAQFFNIRGDEADSIDPQQRFLMEVIYEALESGGQKIQDLSGTQTAVYVGVMCNDYAQITYGDLENVPKPLHASYVAESNVNMLSPTGRSRMWDASADGYARGEGVAAVILKRLSDAVADGDSIECVIRETGTNQDGRTPGITMPSSKAQAQLIRQTYAKAGLSLTKAEDRCQYFEAHGTGTPAGDPQEAAAIYGAFFGDGDVKQPDGPLHVGSIKTVIGHTEGAAGLAGLIKASLSIQNKLIPPNMLFNKLNPDISPYYGNLQITTSPLPWPELPVGVPRRASVNSFGFGGANAHAILESYEPEQSQQQTSDSSLSAIPFLFSANSEKSLATQIESYLNFLETEGATTNLRDLGWTLSKRSTFPLRASVSGITRASLCQRLASRLEAKKADGKPLGVRPSIKNRAILGIFTGQGAQWARMGYNLIESSSIACGIIGQLDESLRTLPQRDRPTWSLKDELSKPSDCSRVMEAAFSQPICTAVQVMLVDLLSRSGVEFDAVVGHSSGEIVAAYAAGHLNAGDAVRIAYYRGLYSDLAIGSGGMLAVATSMEDAQELCDLPTFAGRLTVAASNASSSVTLSGDLEAVKKAKFIFEDEKKFARLLKVDKAYHSSYMQPCAEPYMEAMAKCGVKTQPAKANCRWFSSVLGGAEMTAGRSEELGGAYWRDNLLRPVLFSQALEAAIACIDTPSLALEVGPHPALQGPASTTLTEKCGDNVPYYGVLERGSDDIEAMSQALGCIWCHIGLSAANIGEFDALFSSTKPQFLKTAPLYTWDHDKIYWRESRVSRSMRWRPSGHHELLGVRIDSGDGEYRWRNFIKPNEIPWLRGHQIQGQTIFPGAGYVAMAVEASKVFENENRAIALFEILDVRIVRAMALRDEDAGVECMVSLTNVQYDLDEGLLLADFVCGTCPTNEAPWALSCSAKVRLQLGQPSERVLPERIQPVLEMTDVEQEHFYSALSAIGYNYSDMFQGIISLKRTTDIASGVIHIGADETYHPPFVIHPAPLDVAFQGIFGAIGAPGDGRLWTIMVPTIIRCIRINPYACEPHACLRTNLPFDAIISVSPAHGISGDVDVFGPDGSAVVQIEGLHVSPLTPVSEHDDCQKISETLWAPETPDASRDFTVFWNVTEERLGYADFIERACFFYMKKLHDAISTDERESCAWHPRKYLNWIAAIVDEVSEGRHPIAKEAWLDDTWEALEQLMEDFAAKFKDFRILMELGDNLIPFVRGDINLLEGFRENNALEYIYKNTFGFPEYNAYLGGLVQQLTHKSRKMDILEIGAGTGSATEAILERIDDNYNTYMYTDISGGFFMNAEETFGDKCTYRTLDIEKDPTQEQGYSEHAYDLVVASNVLHATSNLETTLRHVRKLLKPGGHLVMLETTDVSPLRPTFFFGSLPGWWVGEADGRMHRPLLTRKGWEDVLLRTGFSGIDTATPETNVFMVPQSVILSQAVDLQMNLIRQPLSAGDKAPLEDVLVLGGGQSLRTCQLQEDITDILQSRGTAVKIVDAIQDLRETDFTTKRQIVLSLLELDEALFSPFTPEKWSGLQLLTEKARNIVWINQGSSGENPYANMMIGVARCLVFERADLRIQCVDFDVKVNPNAQYIVECVLRMYISDQWKSFVEPYNPAWSLERELRVVDEKVLIPRCVPCKHLDNRYNSSRRMIREDLKLVESTVGIIIEGGTYELQQIKTPSWLNTPPAASVELQVSHSSLLAITLPSVGSLYLVIGEICDSKQKVLAVSDVAQSRVTVPQCWTVPCNIPDAQNASFLINAMSVCLSENILSPVPDGTSILVHEPTRLIAEVIETIAHERQISTVFTTSNSTENGFRAIHPSSPSRSLWKFFPKDLSGHVDMSSVRNASSLGARLEKQIPRHCHRIQFSGLLSIAAYLQPNATSTEIISNMLVKCCNFFVSHAHIDTTERVRHLDLADVPGRTVETGTLALVNWATAPAASVKLSPPENEISFRPDKTYLLAGLSGELGLSLCRWMIQRGARFVVLTSRNPKVDSKWLEVVQSEGATVLVVPMDVTDKRSILKAYKVICKTLPPIAGVAHGAMVLNDGLLSTQSYEDFNGTLRPKVEGARFLSEIFDLPTLDFFIVFSSLAYQTGNMGQSSYAAANGYMISLIEGRRKRGLVGSAMNLAGIFGIGYITRTERGIIERLEKMGYSSMSEWDFHQFFAEAIAVGPPNSGSMFEISSSLRPADPDAENPPAWLPVPRFSYFKRVKVQAAGGKDGKMASVRARLEEQTTRDGVYKVLLSGLTANLYKQLGLSPEENSIGPSTSLVELGIDSLVAVDMRFWFTRELDLDVPVLKLLGGATVEEMIEDTMGRLSPQLVPNVKDFAAATSQTEIEGEIKETEVSTAAEATTVADEAAVDDLVSEDDKEVALLKASDTEQSGSASEDWNHLNSTDSSTGSEASKDAVEPPLAIERKIKMSYTSLQFWILLQYVDNPTVFNLSFRIALRGRINTDRLHKAVQSLGQRHDAFRTAFFNDPENEDEPTHAVLAESPLRLEIVRVLSAKEVVEANEAINQQVYDIARGHTIRIILISVDEMHHHLVFAFHHIAMDGFSLNIMLSELNALYDGRSLPPITSTFMDVMLKQRRMVDEGSLSAEFKYWRKTLAKIPEPIPLFPLASVRNRMPVTRYELGEAPMVTLDPMVVQSIRQLCRKTKSTRFHFFMSIFRVFLFSLVDVDELCVGLVDANRADANTSRTVGCMVNLLPLIFTRPDQQKFSDIMAETRVKAYAALANSRVPMNALLEKLDVPRSATHMPIFQVLLDYIQHRFEPPTALGTPEDELVADLGHNLYELLLHVNDADVEIRIRLQTQSYLYSKYATQILLDGYVRLVKLFATRGAEAPVKNVKFHEPMQVQAALASARGPSVKWKAPLTVSHAIESHVVESPDSMALRDGVGSRLTFAQMSERVNVIAGAMKYSNVSQGMRVAVYQEPTADWICSLVAIWKIGAVFVPLDNRFPTSRLSQLVDKSKPSVILCHSPTFSLAVKLQQPELRLLNISNIQDTKGTVIANEASPENPALILFTSGSTGTPKALELSHPNLNNAIQGLLSPHGFGLRKRKGDAQEIWLQQSAPSFDLAISEVLLGLCNGDVIYVVDKNRRGDPLAISEIILSEKITCTAGTTSEYSAWLRWGATHFRNAEAWKLAVCGGEPLTNTLKVAFQDLAKPLALFNIYGPTETTIACNVARINYDNAFGKSMEPVTIGRPLPNYSVYVVDRETNAVPVGFKGEIVIGGAGVANGYFGQPDLTAAAFLTDKLTPTSTFPGQRTELYRTGDIGRYHEDGNLYVLGRIDGDTQIKLNGIRIELEEVEAVILRTSGGVIHNAVVSVRRNPDFLVGHIEFAAPHSDTAEKRSFLRSLLAQLPLPKYMCPAVLIPLENIPLNPHGKTDRRAVQALALPEHDDNDHVGIAEHGDGLDETELRLQDIWTQVLPEECLRAVLIRATTDFFQLGGNSYLLIILQRIIRERFAVSIPVMQLFDSSTIRAMADRIKKGAVTGSIVWDAETALEGDLEALTAPDTASREHHNSKTGQIVVLTGSTGYLGRHLLQRLVEDPMVSKIHCVAVRGHSDSHPRELTIGSSKIKVHGGDLSELLLGLDEDEFVHLASHADSIIHCGANRSFWDYYQTLRGPNVTSTKTLVRMASKRAIPLHFISSGGLVVGCHENKENDSKQQQQQQSQPGSITSSFGAPPADGSDGYLASKWASEAYLEHAAASSSLRLPVYIHRVTRTPSSSAAAGLESDAAADLVGEIIDLTARLRILPTTSGWSGSFDLIRTKGLVERMIGHVLGDSSGNDESTSSSSPFYVHYASEVHIEMREVAERMKELGVEGGLADEAEDGMERLSPPVWAGRVKKEGFGWHFSGQDFGATGKEGLVLRR
ncbi:MAG: hypothetical protein Q9227_008774 [Pyrenula ochraceoflavens]